MVRKLTLRLIVLLTVLAYHVPEAKKSHKPTVILVSFDGFRWDYMKKTDTPNLDFVAKTGVKAKYVKNAFVTKTFPNHYTIVTGLYEESHGIVANTMYDAEFKAWFYMNNTESRWWNGGEPVWVTNQRQGSTSAVVFWPGSEVEIRGKRPSYFLKYDCNVAYSDRVDHIMKALDLAEPPTFLAVYFEEPDSSGHLHGPDSNEVKDAIKKVDSVAGYLIEQLKSRNLLDKVNLIFTSDHGMTNISDNKVIYLEDYIPSDYYTLISTSPWDAFAQLLPKAGLEQRIFKLLKDVKHLRVYKKEGIPAEYHYENNRRIMPIFVVGEEGWSVAQNRQIRINQKGNHGYSNKYKTMNPFFVACGPFFKENYISEPFQNVDIYPMLCKLLGINPSPNNGSLDEVEAMFRSELTNDNTNYTVLVLVMLTTGIVCTIMCYGITSLYRKYKCCMNRYGNFYDLGTDFDL